MYERVTRLCLDRTSRHLDFDYHTRLVISKFGTLMTLAKAPLLVRLLQTRLLVLDVGCFGTISEHIERRLSTAARCCLVPAGSCGDRESVADHDSDR